MTTDTTITPPFSEYVLRFLLDPATAGLPPNAEAQAERERWCGRHGQHVAALWSVHETWLRQAAAERGIRPSFPRGRFYAEAQARRARKVMR